MSDPVLGRSATHLVPPPGGWTTDQLVLLSEDGGSRELLDGTLLVSPFPAEIHQLIAAPLVVALEN